VNTKVYDEIRESLKDQVDNLRAVRGDAIANGVLATFHCSQISLLVTMMIRHLGEHCEDFDAEGTEKMITHRIGSLNIDVLQWLGIKAADFDEISRTAERLANQCLIYEPRK
jgi:hypothetical protein